MFCIPSFFFFFSLYTLHSPPFEEQSTAESAKASQITWQIIRCNGLKLPVRCARLVFNMLTKRKQRLTCQREKVCMRTVPYTGAFLHPIHERCVLKSCCDWLLSVRCCHLVDKEVHLSSGSANRWEPLSPQMTVLQKKTFTLTVTTSVRVRLSSASTQFPNLRRWPKRTTDVFLSMYYSCLFKYLLCFFL